MDSNGALALEQETEHVQLGHDHYEVIPQPLPYLKRALGPLFDQLGDVDVEEDGIGAFITGNSHKILSVFIPDLMPLHTWEGYRSADDMESDNYDADYARRVAPNGPQVRLAFSICLKVNGLDLVTQIGRLVDPSVLRELATKYIVQTIEPALSSGPRSRITSSVSTPASDSEKSSTTSSPAGPSSEPSEASV